MPCAQLPCPALRLAGEVPGQRLVGPPALVSGRRPDRRGADQRMPERDPVGVLVGPHQVVALGGSEIIELVAVTASRVQHTKVSGTFQGRHEEERPGPGREPHYPWGEEVLQA